MKRSIFILCVSVLSTLTACQKSLQQIIEEVTDPTNNSIYEKCARIRCAFIDVLGNYLAPSYYITGNRGEVKKIVLDRSLVHWENEDFI